MSFWNREDIVWAAGLLEGEGCFHKHSQREHRLLVSVSTTDLDVAKKLQESFHLGTITKPSMDPRNNKGKQPYLWSVQNSYDAAAIMFAVFPFMCSRRKKKIKELIANYVPPKPNGLGRRGKRKNFEGIEAELATFVV